MSQCISTAPILAYYSNNNLNYSSNNSLLFHNYGGSIKRISYSVDISCKAKILYREELLPSVQTLRRFPVEELHCKIVLVRFDSSILLRQKPNQPCSVHFNAYLTIKYLYKAGAKIILTSSWNAKQNEEVLTEKGAAEFLSSVLELNIVASNHNFQLQHSATEQFELADIILLKNLCNYKQEFGNNSEFANGLAFGVDIFVNDSFSSAHKILASTVGVTQFCCVCLAGFYFEDCLHKLKNIFQCNKSPFVAVVGGGKITEKAAALYFLASRCDGIIFVGMMAFQIMHALGLPVPLNLVERQDAKEALELVKIAQHRSIPILLPKDFCCKHKHLPIDMKTFSSENILEGWQPVDLGPSSFVEISSFLLGCKEIMWIGSPKFLGSEEDAVGSSKLALILDELGQTDECHLTIIGRGPCEAVLRISKTTSTYDMIEPASVVWELLKGRILPGLLALDRAYPFKIDWNTVYHDPTQPLAVDIGSGNGLFLIGMAKSQTNLNYLGLEMNEKLVIRCLDSVHQSGLQNLHFIATNATSTFRMIVSSYPGPVELVSIQCPNPDFNQPEHRWSMVQRSLVEAIADQLASGGKVFLQSDVKEVAIRMRKQFLTEAKQKLIIECNDDGGSEWLKDNPFGIGIQSDWERHVLARRLPMYRLMLHKKQEVL